jgi:hypothetical protein
VLDHFDAVLKVPEPNDVQRLLNTLQSLCYDPKYHASNIIRCYRDIEDICQTTNYSDYYKIFGSNHYRVTGVSDEMLKKLLEDSAAGLDSQLVRRIVALSAGCPEHAEVLLRFASDPVESSLEQRALGALDLTFRDWENSLSADETSALQTAKLARPFGPEHFAGRRKLQRKGILVETDGSAKIASPLFEQFLNVEKPAVEKGQETFIRRVAGLSHVHRSMLQELFKGRYYIEWKLLQPPLPGDATVYLISGEDQEGTPFRPCIVKIDSTERAASEIRNLDAARALLGSLVPNVLTRLSLKGQEALVMEYATGDNRNYTVQQFGEFYREHSAQDVGALLERVMGQALHSFYQKQSTKMEAGRKLYFLPRLHQGEFDEIAGLARKSRFYQSADDTLSLPGVGARLPNPGSYLKPPAESAAPASPYGRLFLDKRRVGLCRTHGDLNPRNFLVDGIGNVHLIDFCEMKQEGARFLDFVRLEAEIKFKLAEVADASLVAWVALDSLLVEARTDKQIERLRHLPIDQATRKLVHAIATLRRIAYSYCMEKTDELQLDTEYKLGLLAQTMRLSLFRDYLTPCQREFAVASAALLIGHLEHYESRTNEDKGS